MSQLHAQFMGSVLGMTWRRQLVSTPPVRHKPLLHQLCIQTFSESDRCHYSCFRQECLENTTGPQVNGVPEVKCLDSCSHQSGALLQHCCNASWEEAVCLMKGGFNFFWVPSDASIHSSSYRFWSQNFSGCVEIILSACEIVGGVVGNQDTVPDFFGAGIMHNSLGGKIPCWHYYQDPTT